MITVVLADDHTIVAEGWSPFEGEIYSPRIVHDGAGAGGGCRQS